MRERVKTSILVRTGPILALSLCTFEMACGDPDSRQGRSRPVAGGDSAGSDPEEGSVRSGSVFRDATEEAGLDFVHLNGMTGELYFVEMVGSGGAFLDYDRDGDLDIYLVQGHPLGSGKGEGEGEGAVGSESESRPIDRLYRNDLTIGPDGTRTLRFRDVTEEAGIVAAGYGMGAAVGDYNGDGWVDLYVVNWGANQLWRNDGEGTFSDVTRETGTDDRHFSAGAAFLDFDLDGRLDLVVVNYNRYTLQDDRPCYAQSGRRDYCGPDAYPPEPDRLFHNLGDGTFRDVTASMGLTAYGPALGVTSADFNGDGWPDIYVANDQHENQLWINRSGRRFEDVAVLTGVAMNAAGKAEASMGVSAVDFHADGDEDLFLTHLKGETNTLYINLGDGRFEDRTRRSGLGPPSRPFTGFGVAPLDYDNDGWLDLFIANGEVKKIQEQVERGDPFPLRQTNQLFRNLGGGRFREVTPEDELFALAEVSRGTAYGDVDNDGDTDLLITNNNGPARLLINEVGARNPWLGLRLISEPGRADAIGARVEVVRRRGPTLWRRVHADGSYASAHDPRVLIGLGQDPHVAAVRVHWPDGSVEQLQDLALNRYQTLVRADRPVGK